MLNEYDKLSFWAVCEKEKENCRLHTDSYCKVEYYLLSSDDSWNPRVVYTWDVWHLHRHEYFFPPSFFSLLLCVWSVLYLLAKAAHTPRQPVGSRTAWNNMQTPFVPNYFLLSLKTNTYITTPTAWVLVFFGFCLFVCLLLWSDLITEHLVDLSESSFQ